MKRKIIFVHGFGVRKDSRGMFTDIQKSLEVDENFKDVECVLTDLNIVEEGNNDIKLNPLSVQAEILKKVYNREKSPGKAGGNETILVCHSQGCVVAGIADLEGIEKIILIAPPTNNDLQKTINGFKNRPGTIVDINGESFLMRRDGSKTIVPKEYWSDRENLNYLEQYKKLGEKNNLKIIIAKQDDVVANDCVEELKKIGEVVEIDGNHNFDREYRVGLVEEIKRSL